MATGKNGGAYAGVKKGPLVSSETAGDKNIPAFLSG
jgi:hypothetical protein